MDFDIFGESDEARPGDLEEMMRLITNAIDNGMPVQQGVEILCDMIRPGQSDNSHDVKALFVGALSALGHMELTDMFGAIWLNTMPWGIAFQVSVRTGFSFQDCTPEAQRAIIESLAIVLRLGGLEATVSDDNQILVRGPEGEPQSLSTEDIVGQFRQQMDKTLGPDAPEDPTRKWMP